MTGSPKNRAKNSPRAASAEARSELSSGRRALPATSEGARSTARLRVALGLLLLAAVLFPSTRSSAQDFITTIAGDGISGSSFNLPTGVAVDSFGDLYVADAQNCVVWEITSGVTTAIAGIQGNCSPGTGSGALQSLAYPIDVAVCGNNVYFATHGVDPAISNTTAAAGGVYEISSGTFSTLPSPTASNGAVTPLFPVAIACDSAGDVYVASYFYGAQAVFYGSVDKIPVGSTTTQNLIYLVNTAYPGVTVDSNNNVFALGVPGVAAGWLGAASFTSNGFIYQLSGNGSATAVLTENIPSGLPNTARLATNGVGNYLVTTAKSAGNPTVYVTAVPGPAGGYAYDAGNGTAGYKDNVQATLGELDKATGLTVDACGSIYVADSANNVVRKIFNPTTAGTAPCVTGTGSSPNVPSLYASLTPVQGNGQITAPGSITFYSPVGINNCNDCTTPLQGEVFFCSFSTTDFTPANSTDSVPCQGGATLGSVAVSSTSGTSGNASFQASFLIPGTFYVAAEFFDPPYLPYTTAPLTVTVCGASCSDSGVPNIPVAKLPVALTPGALSESLYSGNGMVALDANGNKYFMSGSAGTVILVDTHGGTSTIVSSSTAVSTGGTLGTMTNLGDIAVGSDSNLYVTDTGNSRVIQVESPASGSPTVNVINIGSTGGTLSPPLTSPVGIFETSSEVYVTDAPSTGPRLVAFRPDGSYPTTVLSSATTGAPALGQLLGVVVNPSTLTIYVANAPAQGSTSGGTILETTIGGTPSVIATPGITLQSPYGMAMDAAGGLYFSDTGTHQVYRVDIDGNVIVVAGNGTATESLANLILGQVAVSAIQTGLANPTWLALDASSSIYILDGGELLYLNVTRSIVDFTAANQSQTIYVTNPVASTQGSVEMEFGSPIVSGAGAADFTVDTTGSCNRTSSNLLSSNTSCTLVLTLGTGGSNTSASACTLSEIEVSLGPPPASGSCAAPPAGLTNQTITLNSITAPATTLQVTGTAVQGTYNVPYGAVTFMAAGGSGTYNFSESGQLPQNMSFSNGVLSGTPEQGGQFPFTVNVTDGLGNTGSLTQTLVINPAVTSTTVMATPNTVGITQPMTLTAAVLYNGLPVTSGSVTFTNCSTNTNCGMGTPIGTVPLNSSGQASLPIDSPGTAGTYQYEATFNGTANFVQSSDVVTVTVNSIPTTVTIPTITEPITVTDTPVVVAEPAQLSIAAPVAFYSVGSLGFGTVAAGQTATQSFSVANIGEAPLSLTGDSFTVGVSFSLTQTLCTNGASSLPTTLPPLAACLFAISYTAPLSGTPAIDAITFSDNAALSNATSTGSGSSYTQTIPLNGAGASTAPGAPPPTTVTIPTITEPITVTDTPVVVAEPAQLSIAAPVAFYSVGSLGFGTVAAGQTATQSFSVANIGEAPLSLTGDSFTVGVSFSLTQTLCTNGASSLPTTLPPLAACVFAISYTAPQSGTPATDAITFSDNAALSNATSTGSGSSYTQTIPLNGSGASTAPGAPPPTTVTIPTIMEPITVTDTPTLLVSQTITATPPAGAKDKESFTVSASGGASGNPLVFTSSGDCRNSGATYTMGNKAGTCTGTITQAGNSNYAAATPYTWNTTVSTTLTKPAATFTGAPDSAAVGNSFVVTATYPETQGVPVEVPTITAEGSCAPSAVSGSGNQYQATITMTEGSGPCTITATWAANFYYASATKTQKTLITPTASFIGAITPAANGTQFTVSASSNENGTYASVPTITASGACTAGTISGSNGTYQATITMTKSSGTCTMTAKWAASIEYVAVTLKQSTKAER